MDDLVIDLQSISSDISYELIECWPDTIIGHRNEIINNWVDNSREMYVCFCESQNFTSEVFSLSEYLMYSIDKAINEILCAHVFEYSDDNQAMKSRLYARVEQIALHAKVNNLAHLNLSILPNSYYDACDPNVTWGQHGAHFPD